jgi:hypothetical protein
MHRRPITLLEYPPIVSFTRLTKERGWSELLIRKHLGPPDALAVNPTRPEFPVRIWLLRRVERAERRPAVISELQRIADGRRLRDMINDGSIEELREKLAGDLAAVSIDVQKISIEELRNRAYAAICAAQGDQPPDFPQDEVSANSMVRYAKRHLVDHEALAEAFEHRAEPWQVAYLLKERIEAAILVTYPELRPAEAAA